MIREGFLARVKKKKRREGSEKSGAKRSLSFERPAVEMKPQSAVSSRFFKGRQGASGGNRTRIERKRRERRRKRKREKKRQGTRVNLLNTRLRDRSTMRRETSFLRENSQRERERVSGTSVKNRIRFIARDEISESSGRINDVETRWRYETRRYLSSLFFFCQRCRNMVQKAISRGIYTDLMAFLQSALIADVTNIHERRRATHSHRANEQI